jgi:hypothetical protein
MKNVNITVYVYLLLNDFLRLGIHFQVDFIQSRVENGQMLLDFFHLKY